MLNPSVSRFTKPGASLQYKPLPIRQLIGTLCDPQQILQAFGLTGLA